ncbi:hypothetical protein [Frankia sp. AiPa1]|uniref:hypothetical protein n=1 Tax=Frankia sp. AiPa1 TaxID=573492 RepID=UPI00202B69F9|nr:hypothetical protein [Frankia sp. AiPa1]MCL9761286.1 hypothetical protein [Frankia sp. AiPa1]
MITAWQAATEDRDAVAAAACLADEVRVVPPNVGRYRFRGRASMRLMLTAAFGFIDDLRYTGVIDSIGVWTLPYQARIAGRPITTIQRLRLGADDLICELTLPGSPPMEFVLAMERIGPRLVAPPEPRPKRRTRGRPAHYRGTSTVSDGGRQPA